MRIRVDTIKGNNGKFLTAVYRRKRVLKKPAPKPVPPTAAVATTRGA